MSNLATITNNILADSGIDDINVIVSTGSYANPAWITSLAWTKITGAPANIVTGTGTTNTIPRFTGSSTIGDSAISDTTTEVNITKRVFITSGVNQFVFTPNLGSTSNRIETLGVLPLEITTSGSSIGMNVGGGSSQFSMTNTGASFFIPVTAIGQAATSPAFIANNSTGTSGTAQHYINFTAGTTTISRMLRGNGAAGLVANGLNIDNFDGFQVRLNQLGGSGGSFNITGGNVGIGTTSPTFRLDVQNNTQAVARVLDTSTNASLILQAGSGSAMKVTAYNYASSTALPLYIQVDGANTIMQSGGGNLLVGTTSDAGYRLDVLGNTRVYGASGNDVSFILQSQGASAPYLILNGSLTSYNLLRFQHNGTDHAGIGAFNSNITGGLSFYTNGISSEKMRIISNGNVGIGTSSPSAMLTLSGTTPYIRIERSGVPTWQIQNNFLSVQNGFSVNNITAGTTPFFIGENGNVGIGTSSPIKMLQVFAGNGDGIASGRNLTNDNISANLFLYPSALTTKKNWAISAFYTRQTTLQFLYSNTSTSDPYFDGTPLMTLEGASGNVLIGTTTDNGARLQVSGATTITGTSNALSLIGSGDVWYRVARFSSYTNIGVDATGSFYNTNTNHRFLVNDGSTLAFTIASTGAATFSSSVTATQFITGGTPSNTAGFTNSFYAESNIPSLTLSNTGTNTGKYTLGVTNGNFGIWNNPTSSYRLFIDSAGNVGIGTTSPIYKLVVSNSGATGLEIDPGTIISNRNLLINYNRSTSSYSQIQIDASLTILGNQGNVLIGTTTDNGARLQVNSANTQLHLSGNGNNLQIYSWGGGVNLFSNEFLYFGRDAAVNNKIYFQARDASSTTLFVDTSTQLVGIGTTSPVVKLDIQNSSSGTGLGDGMILKLKNISTTTNTRSGINFGNIDGIGGSLAMQSAILKSAATGEYDMTWDLYGGSAGWKEGLLYLDSNPGRVGIGTASPDQRLDVRGYIVSNSQGNGSESAFYLGNPAHGLSRANLQNDIILYTTSGDVRISANTASTSHLIVKNNGNVLIGTTTDVGARLYVDGAFRTGTLTAGTQTAAVDWRLGNARGGTATANALIRVQINGVLVDLIGNYV